MHLKLDPEPHMHYTRARLDHNRRPLAETVKGLDGKPMRVARDTFSGDYYVQIAERRSTEQTPQAQAHRDAIDKQKPLHYSSEKPGMTGYWVKIQAPQIPLSDADRALANAALTGTEGGAPEPQEVTDYSKFELPGAVSADAPLQEIKEGA